jgi:hypothetical protein
MLEMYVDGKLIDTAEPSQSLLRTNSSAHLKELMEGLKKKHADLLSGTSSKPMFVLGGVQSCINSFVPLSGA